MAAYSRASSATRRAREPHHRDLFETGASKRRTRRSEYLGEVSGRVEGERDHDSPGEMLERSGSPGKDIRNVRKNARQAHHADARRDDEKGRWNPRLVTSKTNCKSKS
jgi:hypothetical protein